MTERLDTQSTGTGVTDGGAIDSGSTDVDLTDVDLAVGDDLSGGGSSRIRWTALAVGLVVVALVAVLAVGSDDRLGGRPNDLLGQRVPEVAGPTLAGGTYDIDDARGQWVVVNFFATWCPGCINEHPDLVAFEQWGAETGQAEVVSIVFNDPVDRVEQFFAVNGGTWPVLDEPSIPIAFQVAQIPETFLISPSGQVVRHIEGEVRADDLIAFIEENQ